MNGIKQTNLNKIANSFGKFYSTLGSTLVNDIVPGTTPINRYLEKFLRQLNSMRIKLTTPLEIDKIIKELPNKSSYGHNKVSNKMLKGLRPAIMFPLCHIFNQSLIYGHFPEKMKWAEVLPLYKGKSMDEMVNYHPISLLITMSKVLEKVMYMHLYSYLDTNNILYTGQYGFRSKRSCEQAIIDLMGHVLQSKNRNEYSASVFLDLLKVFDTLDHTILLAKLERYGV